MECIYIYIFLLINFQIKLPNPGYLFYPIETQFTRRRFWIIWGRSIYLTEQELFNINELTLTNHIAPRQHKLDWLNFDFDITKENSEK